VHCHLCGLQVSELEGSDGRRKRFRVSYDGLGAETRPDTRMRDCQEMLQILGEGEGNMKASIVLKTGFEAVVRMGDFARVRAFMRMSARRKVRCMGEGWGRSVG
jgi:hypothetical protein